MNKTPSRRSIIIWGCMVLYLIAAPIIHDRFFLREGRPIQTQVELPEQAAEAKGFLDSFEIYAVQDGIYQTEGWGFVVSDEKLPARDYERQVVLVSASGNYVFPAKTTKRVDVYEHFASLDTDLTMSGFLAYINRNALKRGTYHVGLLMKRVESGEIHYVNTGRCLTRTPNDMVLEETNNFSCQSSLQPDLGKPDGTNVKLPAALAGARAGVDGLLAVDEEQKLYQLIGWGFPTLDKNIPWAAFKRQVVLLTPTGNLVFPAKIVERPDVQVYFEDIDMDLSMSGFSAQIRTDMLPERNYEIGLIFMQSSSNVMYFVSTNRCLRREGRALVLEAPESSVCQSQ